MSMKILRIIRSILLGVVVALGIAVLEFGPRVGLAGLLRPTTESGAATPADVPIGGPFHLTDDTGRAVTEATYRGRWMLGVQSRGVMVQTYP
jgi:cytochrome oxidase Cu insertion factor (SCO1/SenC/PrrC family)